MTSRPSSGPEVASSLDDAARLLAANLARLRELGEALRALGARVAVQGADARAREATAFVLHAFDTAFRCHREDQERELFPALLESMAGSDPVCLRDLTNALRDEHRLLDIRWRTLRHALAPLAEGLPAAWPHEHLEAMLALLAPHLRREEAELLPMAPRLLDEAELERIGAALRARRGLRE